MFLQNRKLLVISNQLKVRLPQPWCRYYLFDGLDHVIHVILHPHWWDIFRAPTATVAVLKKGMWLCKRPSSNQQHPAGIFADTNNKKQRNTMEVGCFPWTLPSLKTCRSFGVLDPAFWKRQIQRICRWDICWISINNKWWIPWSCQARCRFSGAPI